MQALTNPFVFVTLLALAGLGLMAIAAIIGDRHD